MTIITEADYLATCIRIWQANQRADGLDSLDHTCYPADPTNPMSRCIHPHPTRRPWEHDQIGAREAVDGENRYERYMGWGDAA